MEKLTDREITDLFFSRDERALRITKAQFGAYVKKIAFGLLRSDEDAEECENDVYLAAWNSIPPQKPQDLAGYLGKLTRRAAIDRVRNAARRKRAGIVEALEEFEEILPSPEQVEDAVEGRELSRLLSAFLRSLPEKERNVFLRRYWFGDDLKELCRTFGVGKSAMKMTLLRTREKLRDYLRKEGIDL